MAIRVASGTLEQIRFRVWRCVICGETTLSIDPPTHCPYCGSHGDKISNSPGEYDASLKLLQTSSPVTETDKANLQSGIRAEMFDSTFYLCASKRPAPSDVQSMFKRLSLVENEHAEILSLAAGIVYVPMDASEIAQIEQIVDKLYKEDQWISIVKVASRREHDAAMKYMEFGSGTGNSRLSIIWIALSEVEIDHASLQSHLMRKMIESI